MELCSGWSRPFQKNGGSSPQRGWSERSLLTQSLDHSWGGVLGGQDLAGHNQVIGARRPLENVRRKRHMMSVARHLRDKRRPALSRNPVYHITRSDGAGPRPTPASMPVRSDSSWAYRFSRTPGSWLPLGAAAQGAFAI